LSIGGKYNTLPMKPVLKTGGQHIRWQMATWRGLPDGALVRPGDCGSEWSAKDVMNHIPAWQEATWWSWTLYATRLTCRAFGAIFLRILATHIAPRARWVSFAFSARSIGAALAPSIAGVLPGASLIDAPVFLSDGIKIIDNLALYFNFRTIRTPEEKTTRDTEHRQSRG